MKLFLAFAISQVLIHTLTADSAAPFSDEIRAKLERENGVTSAQQVQYYLKRTYSWQTLSWLATDTAIDPLRSRPEWRRGLTGSVANTHPVLDDASSAIRPSSEWAWCCTKTYAFMPLNAKASCLGCGMQ